MSALAVEQFEIVYPHGMATFSSPMCTMNHLPASLRIETQAAPRSRCSLGHPSNEQALVPIDVGGPKVCRNPAKRHAARVHHLRVRSTVRHPYVLPLHLAYLASAAEQPSLHIDLLCEHVLGALYIPIVHRRAPRAELGNHSRGTGR